MTYQSPRIYTYKITFEEVPYYYYGMHEEKVYDEEYWGSPQTHKWMWDFYTPKKQILEIFDTRKDAYEIEKKLIKPSYRTDKNCLNECCAGVYSLDVCSKAGKIGGSISGKIVGKKCYENKVGIHSFTSEEKSEAGRKGGRIGGKISAQKHIENKTGIFGLSSERKSEIAKIAGKKSNSQKWKCLVTGFVTNSGGLSHYQRKRGIDTTMRIRLEWSSKLDNK
jgi:hypothetical protein